FPSRLRPFERAFAGAVRRLPDVQPKCRRGPPMPAPDPVRTEATGPEGHASTVWTLALATALIGLVALPRRAGPPADRSSGRTATRPGSQDGARRPSPSHEGGEAEAVARSQADRGRNASGPT